MMLVFNKYIQPKDNPLCSWKDKLENNTLSDIFTPFSSVYNPPHFDFLSQYVDFCASYGYDDVSSTR